MFSELKLKKIRNNVWELTESLVFIGSGIVVPKGFQTDLASVPTGLRWLIHKRGKWDTAAVFHDYLYRTGRNKVKADLLFRKIMQLCGVKPWRYNLMFFGVSIFGWLFWKRNRKWRI